MIKADKNLRKHRNPSFDETIAPHCLLNPRFCYCSTDSGIRRCPVGRIVDTPSFESEIVQPKIDGIYYKGPRVHQGSFRGGDLDYVQLMELIAEDERRQKERDGY